MSILSISFCFDSNSFMSNRLQLELVIINKCCTCTHPTTSAEKHEIVCSRSWTDVDYRFSFVGTCHLPWNLKTHITLNSAKDLTILLRTKQDTYMGADSVTLCTDEVDIQRLGHSSGNRRVTSTNKMFTVFYKCPKTAPPYISEIQYNLIGVPEVEKFAHKFDSAYNDAKMSEHQAIVERCRRRKQEIDQRIEPFQ